MQAASYTAHCLSACRHPWERELENSHTHGDAALLRPPAPPPYCHFSHYWPSSLRRVHLWSQGGGTMWPGVPCLVHRLVLRRRPGASQRDVLRGGGGRGRHQWRRSIWRGGEGPLPLPCGERAQPRCRRTRHPQHPTDVPHLRWCPSRRTPHRGGLPRSGLGWRWIWYDHPRHSILLSID